MLHHLKRYRPPKPVKRWEGPKPRLKMTITPHCRVHFRVLEAYIAKVLKIKGYDVRNATGARGAMTPEFAVTGVLPPANNMPQQVYDIRCGFGTRNLGLILDILCLDGFIQPGIYVIDMTEEGNPIEEYRKVLNDSHDLLDPRCLKIKEKNRGDKNFAKRVKTLDEQLMKLKQEQEDEQ